MLIETHHLEALALGCAVLGAGGGGDTQADRIMAMQAIERHGPVRLVTYDGLPDDGLVVPCAGVGAPTVSIEKLMGDGVGDQLLDAVEKVHGIPPACLMALEIGGGNGLLPLTWAARRGLPVLDADGMGRAFPEMPQTLPYLNGIAPDPLILTEERGPVVVIHGADSLWSERLARSVATTFGGACYFTNFLMTVDQARKSTVEGSVSRALRIGQAILDGGDDPLAALLASVDARRLVTAKIVDVERHTHGGFVRGSLQLDGTGPDRGRLVRLEVQNENLVALEDGEVLASVPDIITIVDAQTAVPIATESLRYGQRVAVLALPCDPGWLTPAGLELAGPRAFGYDFDYQPVKEATDVA